LESNEFVDKLTSSYDKENLPNGVYVFQINVKNPEMLQQSKSLISKLNKMSSLKTYFSNPDFSYSSNYINYEGPSDITSKLMEKFVAINPEYKEFTSNLKEFMKGDLSQLVVKNVTSTMHVINFNSDQLNVLDYYLQKNYENLASTTANKFAILLLFNVNQIRSLGEANQILGENTQMLMNQLANSRNLQDGTVTDTDTEAAPTNNDTPANTATADSEDEETETGTPINITPNGLSGILISFGAVAVLLVALSCLTGIQTPIYFVKQPLNIGREQL